MKLSTAVLAASVAVNLAFCAVVLLRPSPPLAPSSGDTPAEGALPAGPERPLALERETGPDGPAATLAAAPDASLWKSLHDEDPATFEKRLRAAGVPDHAISALLAADARERIRLRQQAGTPERPAAGAMARDTPPKTSPDPTGARTIEVSAQAPGPLNRNLDFIDPSRRDQARTIARDYDAMLADLRRGGALLTETEKETVALLESERHRDLEAILTPTELADFEMLKSPIYSRLAYETLEFKPTLEEFRAIYAMERQFMDRFGTTGMSSIPPRREERAAAEQFRAAADDQLLLTLGTERFAEYDRSRNYEYRELSKLVRRVNLPTTQAAEVFAMRDYVSVESNRIYEDRTLSIDQKRAALQSLATGVRGQIQQRLGNEAGTAYLQLADRWLAHVEQGSAVTFKSHNMTSFRRLPTARPPTPGGG